MKTQIETIVQWNIDAGNTDNQINVRQSALYLGLQLEEMAEKLFAVGFTLMAKQMDDLASQLKKGWHDFVVAKALDDPKIRQEMLDADCDLIVVSAGAGMSQGADINGALWETVMSNESKRDDSGKLVKDANGKIIKGPNFKLPNLLPFLFMEM